MKSFDEALALVLAHRPDWGAETVPLSQGLRRTLALPLTAQHPSPRFDNSAVDGYAMGSLKGPHRLTQRIAAGMSAGDPLKPDEAARVFTGAPVPLGTAAAAMQEYCREEGGIVHCDAELNQGQNLRLKGEEFGAGTELLPAGTRLHPPALALAASQGFASVTVRRLPTVGLLASGQELRQPGEPLGEGQIYESNSFGLSAGLLALGIVATVRSCGDSSEATTALMADLLSGCDVLITSGGVSVGDHDLLPGCAAALGFRPVVSKVSMKPGKPFAFSVRDDGKAWFGLPGNPLSAFAGFALFVAPFLVGCADTQDAPLDQPISRKNSDREEFVPCQLVEGRAVLQTPLGSHSMLAMLKATHLARLPAGQNMLPAGESVRLCRLPWR